MKNRLVKPLIFLLAILMAIIGYCVYDYINNKYFAGVYELGKFIALSVGFIPIMIADIVKSKRIGSIVFPFVFVCAVFAFYYFTMPTVSYDEGVEELEESYEEVSAAAVVFDDVEGDEVVPSYYEGAYIFEASDEGKDYYVVMNPRDGSTYEFNADEKENMARYFE